MRNRAQMPTAVDFESFKVRNLCNSRVKSKYSDVIEATDDLILDAKMVTYIVGELHMYCLMDSERDAIADAFETFIGPSLKGGQGQFFTPRNVVNLIVEMIDPNSDERIIDPACGSGGFLVRALKKVWQAIDETAESMEWPPEEVAHEKQEAAIKNFRGIDKDSFLSKVAKAYMAVLGDGRGGVFCENGLDSPSQWKPKTRNMISLNSFDVVITNPPFGKKLKIDDTTILDSYQLGHKWSSAGTDGLPERTDKLQDSQSPQILYVERCLNFLKEGGRLGFIAPESMFCNPSHRYIVEYIKSVARIRAVISMPEELFQPYTHAKTCAVIIEKTSTNVEEEDHAIFMAAAKWCGHDSRGHAIPNDDIPTILDNYRHYISKGSIPYDHLGFELKESSIKNNIYLPKYHNPEIDKKLSSLKKTHKLVMLSDLVDKKLLEISTGHEVGKLAYGTGTIPFIRSSDIANWEIKLDPKHGLSEDIYNSYKTKQDVREGDILMVRDGTYLVGTCAMVTENDTKIVYQSHIYKIRSNDHKKIHPYLLLAVLTSPIVKEQIYAKRFTQDIIDTLGTRIQELVLPIPKSAARRKNVIAKVEDVMNHKLSARRVARSVIMDVAPVQIDDDSERLDEPISEFFTMTK